MSGEGVRQALLGRSAYSWFRSLGTRWSDNDVYAHVNNVAYYSWFDTVVNQWLIEADLLDIERGNPIGLVVETGCRYARPLSYPEPVEIGLGIDRVGGSSVSYRLGVFSACIDEPAAEGRFVHVYVDRETRRPVVLPPAWRKKFAAILMKSHGNG